MFCFVVLLRSDAALRLLSKIRWKLQLAPGTEYRTRPRLVGRNWAALERRILSLRNGLVFMTRLVFFCFFLFFLVFMAMAIYYRRGLMTINNLQ